MDNDAHIYNGGGKRGIVDKTFLWYNIIYNLI